MDTITVHTNFAVQSVRWITDSVFALRFDRNGIDFSPGQYVSVGPVGTIDMREYSIYSPPQEDHLEILVKVVDGGSVSHALAKLAPGTPINVDGPFGFFTIDDDWRDVPYYFIATGTGISPFRSITAGYPGIDFRLYHGTRLLSDRYDLDQFEPSRITRCVSRESGGDFHGRVTEKLKSEPVDQKGRYYLCGNCDMIYEAFDILQDAGVPHTQIFAEVYF